MHSSKIIHGDVKGVGILDFGWSIPLNVGTMFQANVLISDNGQALLTDFGFSCLENPSFGMSNQADNYGRGTINWIAPEVLDGGITYNADVWSFGMTALVCLSFICQLLFPNWDCAGVVHP